MFQIVIFVILNLVLSDGAKILAVFPTPSISHQVVFRPLTQELAKRGHKVVVVTTDPAFPEGQTPENLTEIDVHELSYANWRRFVETSTGKSNDIYNQLYVYLDETLNIFEKQMSDERVKKVLKENDFDLLLLEECQRPTLGLTHYMNVSATITVSSFGSPFDNYGIFGAPVHPIYYPSILRQRTYDLSILEKVWQIHHVYKINQAYTMHEKPEHEMLKRLFGGDMPQFKDLYRNVGFTFLNTYDIFDHNRPLPPNVINIGGIHSIPKKGLPQDLKSYLDSSDQGVIYVSFGTNSDPKMFPPAIIQKLCNVFSKLPYNVLWKFDGVFPDNYKNIRTAKWFPQVDVLGHKNIKLFITQGGLQSTDESIDAGVPLLGIPLLGDQWYNTENYIRLKIGKKMDFLTFTEEELNDAILTITKDESYRSNVMRLKRVMQDQPQRPLERAIWWTEHVLRHGAEHLRAPTANISWAEYYELKLVAIILIAVIVSLIILLTFIYVLIKKIVNFFALTKKVKKT